MRKFSDIWEYDLGSSSTGMLASIVSGSGALSETEYDYSNVQNVHIG